MSNPSTDNSNAIALYDLKTSIEALRAPQAGLLTLLADLNANMAALVHIERLANLPDIDQPEGTVPSKPYNLILNGRRFLYIFFSGVVHVSVTPPGAGTYTGAYDPGWNLFDYPEGSTLSFQEATAIIWRWTNRYRGTAL